MAKGFPNENAPQRSLFRRRLCFRPTSGGDGVTRSRWRGSFPFPSHCLSAAGLPKTVNANIFCLLLLADAVRGLWERRVWVHILVPDTSLCSVTWATPSLWPSGFRERSLGCSLVPFCQHRKERPRQGPPQGTPVRVGQICRCSRATTKQTPPTPEF